MLNIDTSNIFENVESTCVPASYNYDIVQCNIKSDSNLTNIDNINDKDNIKDSAYDTEYALRIDENLNALIVNNNNMMSGK